MSALRPYYIYMSHVKYHLHKKVVSVCYLVGTDILDWIMVNLDGANSVEQAQVCYALMVYV